MRLKGNGYAPKPAGLATKSRISVALQALHYNHNILGAPIKMSEADLLNISINFIYTLKQVSTPEKYNQ
ncbi:hypothetical protein C6A37_06285 [Desulfobacteraceae bacterium SEEP-SAG9]|nr:hypothetical protein C6A37_06285 [Desulfobacteraceae bacterium SEEP-SAG9]